MKHSERSVRKQGLAVTICLLMLGSETLAARGTLRAGHIRHHDKSHDYHHDKHVVDQIHASQYSHVKNADLIVSGNFLNKTLSSSRILGRMSQQDLYAVENAILFGQESLKPVKDLQGTLMKRAQDMDTEEIIDKLGDKVPIEVVNIVEAKKTERTGQPFSEESLTKARNILNGMVFDAQLALDQKLIECKVFEMMNRGTHAQVMSDLARIASTISDLSKMQSEARLTMAESDDGIAKLEGKLKEETKAYKAVKAEDDLEMIKRKADVAIAEFILGITICADKKPPAAKLFQTGTAEPATIDIMKCQGDKDDFRFADPQIEQRAQRDLTPEARRKLQMWLGDVHDYALVQTEAKDAPDADDANDEEDDLDDLDAAADDIDDKRSTQAPMQIQNVSQDATHAQMQVQSSSEEGPPKEEGPPAATPPPPPPPGAKVVPPQSPKPDPLKPPKCVLSKTNCGLLHDNMSILWGKWKDLVDELQAKMDQDEEDFEALKKNLNSEKEVFVTAKGTAETQLAEATGEKNGATEEQAGKDKELRALDAKFKEVWGLCKQQISEIMFTDICGVLVVRGEVMKFSKVVGCKECKDQIVDCEVDDWIPELCSVPCDNDCTADGTKKDGTLCGGTQVLNRKVVVKNNKFGIKCVPLTSSRSCGQILCPVDCKMSSWSTWGKCTKECEGGSQARTRSILKKPKNGGEQCDTPQEAQSCNTGSCDRDCTLKKWTDYTPCSQACGKGFQEKFRKIKIPTRGEGKCPKKLSAKRYHKRHCNPQACVGDEKCLAKMDLMIAIDGSGSLRESGYKVMKDYTVEYIKRMTTKKYGRKTVKVGILQFGNGQILKDGTESTISAAMSISPLESDLKKVIGKLEATVWEKGFTNLAQVFAAAETMTMNGRKKAYSQLVIISDGKPSFKFSTKNEAQKLKDKGVNVFFININASPNLKDVEYLKKEIVSQPWNVNYLQIPGLQKLKREMPKWVGEALVQTCPKAISPTQQAAIEEAQGFKLIKEGAWCGETPKSKPNEDPLHKFLGVFASPAECMNTVQALEGKYFSYGTETGKKPNNQGMCYMETTKDGKACPEKFVNGPTNYYEIVPMDIEGEGPPMK